MIACEASIIDVVMKAAVYRLWYSRLCSCFGEGFALGFWSLVWEWGELMLVSDYVFMLLLLLRIWLHRPQRQHSH